MINKNKWINSLPQLNLPEKKISDQIDHDKWVNTIPKKNTYDSVKKYSAMIVLFVSGLLLVSAVKNETRSLQKRINNLEASAGAIKFNLSQAILDYEVITSPDNLSQLAKQYLNTDLVSYKKSQIQQLNDESVELKKENKIKKITTNTTKKRSLSKSLKAEAIKRIDEKKIEIDKLQKLYSDPKLIPKEVKKQVAEKIKRKKIELENLYNEPKELFTVERISRWTVVQVVKVFLGMPIIPGR